MSAMPTLQKLELLEKIYQLYEGIIKETEFVCKSGCDSCCTCNVTVTGLETIYLINALTDEQKTILFDSIKSCFSDQRFIPKTTINEFARMLAQGQEPPDEENDPTWGSCPLIENEHCTVYGSRPFGCRNLVSEVDCRTSGFAQVPPAVLTINNIFQQYIEHLDQGGVYGNLSDMLKMLSTKPESEDERAFLTKRQGKTGFLRNERIFVLMVPPEHRKRVEKIVGKLNAICS